MPVKGLIQRMLAMPFSLRQKRLSSKRPPIDQDTFCRRILDLGGDEATARLIYDRLQDWIYVLGFTPYPQDNLESIYGIAEEELDEELVLDIFLTLDVPVPDPDQLALFGNVDSPLKIAKLITCAREDALKQ